MIIWTLSFANFMLKIHVSWYSKAHKNLPWLEFSETRWGLPDAFCWSNELPWVFLSVFRSLVFPETFWITPTKSSCRLLVFEWRMMMEVLQNFFKGLDNLYGMYGKCLNDKNWKRTSGFQVCKLRLKTCTNGVFLSKLTLGLFSDGLKLQTISKWCLEEVWMTPLVRTCRICNLEF